MAYFDSPKNRAMWNLELEALSREREAYIAFGGHNPQASVEAHAARVRVTYAELLMEERGARRSKAVSAPGVSRALANPVPERHSPEL